MNTSKVSDFIGRYWRKEKNRKLAYTAVLAVVILTGGWYWFIQSQATYVPQEFYDSRDRAAEISTKIVQLTDASVITLGQISAADEKGQYKRGLELVNQEVERNTEIKSQAFKLSEELKVMALNLSSVNPDKSAEAGLQATAIGLELVQRLINYNSQTQELLAVLQTRLKKNGSPETRQRIEQIILRMNQEVEAVNNLNDKYQEEIGNFDRLTRQ